MKALCSPSPLCSLLLLLVHFLSSPLQETTSPSTLFREATGAHPSLCTPSPSLTSTGPSRGIFLAAIGRRDLRTARAWIERPAPVLRLWTKSNN
ncbi:hypothetical protein C4D60_Mb01t12060 [Musa balbisiana]|uniref:Secreted protein n=1 Tax=Musa balbisiana TaxID=52838 RepID=A0A4S8JLN0_MUSBA|nr:hypothetical protein C4D60_Mb01t12060 [Musa balbisiana]